MAKGLGRREQWDIRNLEHLARTRFQLMLEPYKERTLPWKLSGIYDQGQTGTCVGHGGIAAYEATPYGHMMGTWLRPYDLYRMLVVGDAWPDNDFEANVPDANLQFGTSVLRLMDFFKNTAQIIPSYTWMLAPEDVAKFVRWTKGGVAVLGVNWYSNMDFPSPEGVIQVSGSLEGGHCFICFWYDPARDLFWCLNSWGLWGVANPWDKRRIPFGCFAIPGSGMRRLLNEQGEAAGVSEWHRKPKVNYAHST